MCRHLAYLGPPVSLASLVLEPEHSLYKQSWAPSDMRGGGSVNADGFGIGWYVDDADADAGAVAGAGAGATPGAEAGAAAGAGSRGAVRYRRSVPIWADESLPGLAASIHSGAVLAAVRNGTVGSPLNESAVAPFVRDRWLFSHNGLISGWPGSVSKLAETLPASELLTLDAPMDSALLWALIQDRLYSGSSADAGSSAAEAVASVVREVAAAAPDSRLNVLLTDGEQIVATTWTHSLWVRRTAESVAVSSEPWTADGWEEVPDRSLVLATRSALAITTLTPSNPVTPSTLATPGTALGDPMTPGTPLASRSEELPMEGRQCHF